MTETALLLLLKHGAASSLKFVPSCTENKPVHRKQRGLPPSKLSLSIAVGCLSFFFSWSLLIAETLLCWLCCCLCRCLQRCIFCAGFGSVCSCEPVVSFQPFQSKLSSSSNPSYPSSSAQLDGHWTESNPLNPLSESLVSILHVGPFNPFQVAASPSTVMCQVRLKQSPFGQYHFLGGHGTCGAKFGERQMLGKSNNPQHKKTGFLVWDL